MRLTKCEMPKCVRVTSNLELIDEFIESGEECVRIDGWENRYKSSFSVCNSINASAKRFGKNMIKCITRNRQVFLVNLLKTSDV